MIGGLTGLESRTQKCPGSVGLLALPRFSTPKIIFAQGGPGELFSRQFSFTTNRPEGCLGFGITLKGAAGFYKALGEGLTQLYTLELCSESVRLKNGRTILNARGRNYLLPSLPSGGYN